MCCSPLDGAVPITPLSLESVPWVKSKSYLLRFSKFPLVLYPLEKATNCNTILQTPGHHHKLRELGSHCVPPRGAGLCQNYEIRDWIMWSSCCPSSFFGERGKVSMRTLAGESTYSVHVEYAHWVWRLPFKVHQMLLWLYKTTKMWNLRKRACHNGFLATFSPSSPFAGAPLQSRIPPHLAWITESLVFHTAEKLIFQKSNSDKITPLI